MILVLADSPKGQLKKGSFEAVTYGKKVADAMGTQCAALVLGSADDAGQLGQYGAAKVIHLNNDQLNNFDSQTYTAVVADVAKQLDAKVVIVSHSSTGKSLVGRLAVRLDAGSVAGVNQLPTVDGGFKVKKNVFSGKAIAEYEISSPVKVLSLMGNSIPVEATGAAVAAESMDVTIPASKITVKDRKTIEGTVPLPEAELVVSAGRGMKGPENCVQ